MLRRRLVREVPQRVVEREEHRQLREHRQARGGGVDVVLAVELHQLLVLLLLVRLVLLLNLLHLRREPLQVLHRVDLPHGERHEQDPDDHRQRDDRPRPRQADAEVQPVEDVPRRMLERRERVRHEDEREVAHRTGSNPPRLHGLQRSSRQPAMSAAADEPVLPERLHRVLRAGRVVLARRREERPEGRPVQPDEPDPEIGRRAQDDVHAAAFVIDSTSSTRSPSHSKPFAATASGRPARTIST